METNLQNTPPLVSGRPSYHRMRLKKRTIKKKMMMRKKQNKRRKKTSSTSLTIPDYIIKQWIESLSGKRITLPANCIPILYCQKENYAPWLYTMIKSVYRKRKEWCAMIHDMENSAEIIGPADTTATLTNTNPFLFKQTIAKHLDKLLHINTTLYMIILRCVQRKLLAKMDQRVVGEEDLHTTTRIPSNMVVAVYDYKTRAKYLFHTNTILKIILMSLKYSAYGIPTPKFPRNPYTNLEWTKPQLVSITQQIVRNMSSIHRIPPPLFLNYYNCNYNIICFAKFCEKELIIHAAQDLFKNKDDHDTREIYGETIDDTAEELGYSVSPRICDMIVNRKLEPVLQEKWDNLVIALWIYTNIRVIYGQFKNYDEMTDEFRIIYKETRIYVYNKLPQRRPRSVNLPVIHGINILIDDVIYDNQNILIVNDEDVPLTVNLLSD